MHFDATTLDSHEFHDNNAKLEECLMNLTKSRATVCGNPTQVVSANVIPPKDTMLASIVLPVDNFPGRNFKSHSN